MSTKVKAGDWLEYNDGRPGHVGVKAEVLTVTPVGMTVQFEDRADVTRIRFSEREWMDNLRVIG